MVGAAGCGLVGAGSVLGLHPSLLALPCGLRRLKNKIKKHTLYEFVLCNLYKNCMNWYKNHTVYEFVLYNLYNNCMNLFVQIRTQISGKNCIQVGILTRDQYRACNRRCACYPPPHLLRQWPFYLYTVQLRKSSEKRDCTNSFVLHIINPFVSDLP